MSRKHSHQRKVERRSKKAAKVECRQHQRNRDWGQSSGLLSELADAEALLDEGNTKDAVQILEDLAERYPRRTEVLGMLVDAYFERSETWLFQAACQRLIGLAPELEDCWFSFAGAALGNCQMATAHRAFSEALSRWPNHKGAHEARSLRDSLEQLMRQEAAIHGIPAEDAFELLLLHDEINLHLHLGDYDRVIDVADKLLSRCPTFAAALNNRSEAQFRFGRLDLALADARRVLEFDAVNFHALGNLTRYLFLSGDWDEARLVAKALKEANSDSPDLFIKRAEALAILGDWQGILETLKSAEARGIDKGEMDLGLIYHLAGVAAAELGQQGDAQRFWKRSIKIGSVADWSRQNLEDAKRPPGEQNGPWAFPIEQWIPRPVMYRLTMELNRAVRKDKDAEVSRCVSTFFEQHANLKWVLPLLLQRGDPVAKEFVVGVAAMGELPWLLPAVKEFVFGRRGTDQLRHQVAAQLLEVEALTPGLRPMWKRGELSDVLLTSFEITDEPIDPLPEDLEPLATEAWQAIRDGDGVRAETLLGMAIQFCPDHPSFAYNRAIAIQIQGREEEALTLVRELHDRRPDYLFARVRLAEKAVEDRDFKAARALLDPLMTRSRFHHSEYAAFCHAHITLLEAEGESKGARKWLEIWEDVAPDDPRVAHWKARLKRPGSIGKLFRRALTDISEE